jgi:hypothetical protein
MTYPFSKCRTPLSVRYKELCARNIKDFIEKMNQVEGIDPEKEYCYFVPSFGDPNKINADFIIYGQAVNGWDKKTRFTLKNAITAEQLAKIIDFAEEYGNTCDKGDQNPIDWVNTKWSKYGMYRSFFWNVCYKLISDYHGFDREASTWSEKMIWSNLMKIAPLNGGNPNELEFEMQLETSIRLFEQEIRELKPKYAIILTNLSWFEPFIEKLSLQEMAYQSNSEIIEWVGKINHSDSKEKDSTHDGTFTKIIVTHRPNVGNSDNYVNEILRFTGKEE